LSLARRRRGARLGQGILAVKLVQRLFIERRRRRKTRREALKNGRAQP
jgi:hypothetical protein